MSIFSLIGILCLVSALDSIFRGPFAFGDFFMKIFAGLLFGGVGAIFLYFYFLKDAASRWFHTYRQRRYGDRPWMLKRAWRKGRITYREIGPAAFLWVFSLGWNGMLGLVLVGNRSMILESIREDWVNAPILLLFILIGLGVLYAAIRLTFARSVSRRAVFTMESVPGVIGGKLRGAIRTRLPARFDQAVTLKLASASSAPIEKSVSREQMQETPKGLVVPVDINIPDSCEGTNIWDPERKVEWTLEGSADVDGKSWEVKFAVPLFKVGVSGE
jgi:hypothetical protein